ncbi:MFS transporter [Streptomyces chumphonensis]|uniref:MFS transporter n=1 Tax=Streptomyces chumphonensis TaxID=1214925 RepID=A0A927F461_9ACTN|nr:MFS transporter [Streptomyces chumphonensis]MBD3934422.1 MFS transporter [Streptomyces chumphonensis]
MTASTDEGAVSDQERARPRAVLPALCLTQVVSWGTVYYAFPVLNPSIVADTGWSAGVTSAAFSLGLLVSALAGILVGRIIDRHGPRAIMTGGSVVGAVSLLVLSGAPNPAVFTFGWLLAGLAMAATFYQPAFVAITRWWAPGHIRPLTVLTLAGGLASTIFAPLTAALDAHLSWRTTYLVLAGVIAVVTVPVHCTALRAPWPPSARRRESHPTTGATNAALSRPFRMLALSLTLSALTTSAVVIALVPLFLERGYSAAQAAWALGLGGAGQTVGRTLYAMLARRFGAVARTTVLVSLSGAATLAFSVIQGPYPLLLTVAVIAGMIRGNLTLLQATAVTDRWGTGDYGRLSGLLAAPTTTAAALAPFVGTVLVAPLGGYAPMFALLAGCSFLAAAGSLGTRADSG